MKARKLDFPIWEAITFSIKIAGACCLLYWGNHVYLYKESLWLLLLIGAILVSWREGVRIDVKKRRFRYYNGFWGIGFGRWKSLEKYPYLFLLRKKKRHDSMDDDRVAEGPLTFSVDYEVFLGSRNHLRRLKVCYSRDRNKALETIRSLSEELEIPFVKYNPGKLNHQLRH